MSNRIKRKLILPLPNSSYELQLSACLKKLVKEQSAANWGIVQISIFIDAQDNQKYLTQLEVINKIVMDHLGEAVPISVIAQPPANYHPFSIELATIEKNDEEFVLVYKHLEGVNYSLIQYQNHKEIFTGGISAHQPLLPLNEQVNIAYSALEAMLLAEGMHFGNIIRQWNYVEDILGFSDSKGPKYQNYQILNDIRSSYYASSAFKQGYPAATGIGMSSGGFVLEVYAVSNEPDTRIIPIKNPNQVDAYKYSGRVLVSQHSENQNKTSTPKFERAKFIGNNHFGTIYISGTASIRNEVTIDVGSTQMQTKTTLDNIASLISPENLKLAGLHGFKKNAEYSFVRAYIKNKEDVDLVRSICTQFYGSVPVNYLIADVCRNNLLVEIEAEACVTQH